ncbi:MAG: redox-sensing transcriptional repressor Rex, partial [Oscillospiraceae bacterium]|nr:redox-sensing transcriptional repressor Rex [Oscillospiraceae bacterium]
MERKEISKAVLKRLPSYLAYLKSLPEDSSPYMSATTLANALGMGEVLVRKDLAMVSSGGRPKIGYMREGLIEDIS